MFTRPSQLPASRDLPSKQAAHCTVRSARSGAQREERMLLNKMYGPLWESSDSNWPVERAGSCALARVRDGWYCEQHTGGILGRVSGPTSVAPSPHTGLSGRRAKWRWETAHRGKSGSTAKAYRTIRSEAVCCTAPCVAD